jgi:hypothetical protein
MQLPPAIEKGIGVTHLKDSQRNDTLIVCESRCAAKLIDVGKHLSRYLLGRKPVIGFEHLF